MMLQENSISLCVSKEDEISSMRRMICFGKSLTRKQINGYKWQLRGINIGAFRDFDKWKWKVKHINLK